MTDTTDADLLATAKRARHWLACFDGLAPGSEDEARLTDPRLSAPGAIPLRVSDLRALVALAERAAGLESREQALTEALRSLLASHVQVGRNLRQSLDDIHETGSVRRARELLAEARRHE